MKSEYPHDPGEVLLRASNPLFTESITVMDISISFHGRYAISYNVQAFSLSQMLANLQTYNYQIKQIKVHSSLQLGASKHH